MPSRTQGDLIREHGDQISALVERLDHLRRDLDRIETHADRNESSVSDTKRVLHDVDKRLAIVARDVERLEKKVDDLLARRWDLWKLILAAFLGSLLAVASTFVSKALDRVIESRQAKIEPAIKVPQNKSP